MELVVSHSYSERRVDKFLREVANLTQGCICNAVRKGKVFVNTEKVSYDYRLKTGDVVNVVLDKQTQSKLHNNKININFIATDNNTDSNKNNYKILQTAKKLKSFIIFENDDVLCINKPHNISIQGGSGVNISIDDCLPYLVKNAQDSENMRIVHRIDSGTAGAVVFAKNLPTARLLAKMFANKEIKKTYYAILVGVPKIPCGIIKTYMVFNEQNGKVIQVKDYISNSKEAITEYTVLKSLMIDDREYSLVKFIPITGRKHQIRIHSNSLKCYIAGDNRYSIIDNTKGENKIPKMNLQLFSSVIDAGSLFKVQVTPQLNEYFRVFQAFL